MRARLSSPTLLLVPGASYLSQSFSFLTRFPVLFCCNADRSSPQRDDAVMLLVGGPSHRLLSAVNAGP